jgi:nucleoid DNA-binding protein
MAARKKPTAKTTGKSVKKKPAVKVATKKASPVTAKPISVKDPLSKSGITTSICDASGVAKKDVVAVLDTLNRIIEAHIKSRGPGKFVLPGLLKIVVVKKPARPARKGVNPFTGEDTMFKAKPAHKVVKVKALKKLKEMAD